MIFPLSKFKYLKFIFLLVLSISVIGCLNNEKNLSFNQEEEIDKILNLENTKVVYDKKRFFNDLKYEGLESLKTVIDSSDEVRAYNWNGNSGNAANVYNYIVDAYDDFEVSSSKPIILSKKEVLIFKEIITDNSIYSQENSMCFIPHIAFVYFKNNKIIGQSNICFLCAGIKSVPKSTKGLNFSGISKLKKFCTSLGLKIIDGSEPLEY